MSHSILITQCLQNDFVKPLDRYEALPNVLHVGFDEARRLMGDIPHEGPVALTMQWAYQQPADDLSIIHIRDWHDPHDPFQAEHLRQFGPHCLLDSEGADFAFPEENPERAVLIINSPGLNDFVGTALAEYLDPFAEQALKVGLVGVWTEAKITFLAYDLRTRYPNMQLAVCSALTASSSRSHHFMALEQLHRLLGVTIYSSVGEFTNFLNDTPATISLPTPIHGDRPEIILEDKEAVSQTDRTLIRYLFRDCQQVELLMLSGGFSGNLVLASQSVDLYGHQQVPHVVKIGPQGPIGQERTAFEQVESVLGNSAPRITAFADLDGRGGLKYRYAAMGGGFSNTFQKLYCANLPRQKIEHYLTIVFKEQLGRFYNAATLEQSNLLDYYWFKAEWATGVREVIESIVGEGAKGETLRLPTGTSGQPSGREFPNPYLFYARDLAEVQVLASDSAYFSYVHGDLNGANIIIDTQDNVWLIDFFHTHQGHVLKDLIKLENDILYIFTPLNKAENLEQALHLTDCLLQVDDLGRPLPPLESTGLTDPEMQRAYETIRFMRSFYPDLVQEDRNPLQLLIGQLRYAVHNLSFDESNEWQKQWALYTAGHCAAKISKQLKLRGPLRVDWLEQAYTGKGRLGVTILPGRKDYRRSLPDDIRALKKEGITHVVPLITKNEFNIYGVDRMLEVYQEAGFTINHLPILDQSVCSAAEMSKLMRWFDDELATGAKILLHCVGGLGRSGLVAACYLSSQGLDAAAAIAEVRRIRSPRAIETEGQETFVHNFVVDS